MKSTATAVLTVMMCAASSACDQTAPTRLDVLYVVGSDGNFRTITAALEAAPAGTTIEVRSGTYSERVVVSKAGMKLRGSGATLDGAAPGQNGRGIGILVANAADVEISGFTVRNFERGIVLENATNTILRNNNVHANNSRTASTAPPLAPGVDLFEGVVLIRSSNNQVIDNVIRDNGHDGIMITGGSRNNIIRANRITNNGAQTVPGQFG